MPRKITKRTLEKWLNEEVDLHKRIITSYLWQQGFSLRQRNRFFILYDHYVNWKNIRDYAHLHVEIFIKALVRNELGKFKNYIQTRPTQEERAHIDTYTTKRKIKTKKKR